jgi:putative chitinase
MKEIFRAIMPAASDANIDKYLPIYEKYKGQYLFNKHQEAMFLAQIAVESNQLKRVEENLFYTTPERLMAVWPSRFKTKESALPYIRNPRKLGDKVYSGRMGNSIDEGFKFRGRGLIQCTGKINYTAYSKDTYGDLRVLDNPDILLLPEDAMLSAFWFWKKSNLNAIATDVLKSTKKINGGVHGLADRTWHYNAGLKAFKL